VLERKVEFDLGLSRRFENGPSAGCDGYGSEIGDVHGVSESNAGRGARVYTWIKRVVCEELEMKSKKQFGGSVVKSKE